MKPRIIVLSVTLAIALAVAGCTHFQQTLTAEERTYAATRVQDIFMYFDELPTAQYKEIGTIVASKDEPADAVAFIKEQAAKMGANALVNCEVRVHTSVILIIFIPIPVHTYIASGVAVKYTNL